MRLTILVLCLAYVCSAQETVSPTTQKPVTTVAPPTPVPHDKMPPKANYHVIDDKDNVTCINAEFAAQFIIDYEQTEGKKNVTAYLDVVNATLDSDYNKCAKDAKTFVLGLVFNNNNTRAQFHFNKTDKAYYIERIDLQYLADAETFPSHPDQGKNVTASLKDLNLFSVETTKSYLCKAGDKVKQDGLTVKFTDVRTDAFIEAYKGPTEFRAAVECNTDEDISNVVPIAVGCALLALVFIVLIAYFIGRRRSRRLAYQSV